MRIFLGTHEISGQLSLLAQGFRALGHEVAIGVPQGYVYKFAPEAKFQIYLRPNDLRQVEKIINYYDVFLFQYGRSLLPHNRDFPLIKTAGKKIISIFCGSDIRYWPAYSDHLSDPMEKYYEGEKPNFMRDNFLDPLLSTLRRAELFADMVLSEPSMSSLALRPYNQVYAPLMFKEFKVNIPDREVPQIVHAPSVLAMKGSKFILEALAALKGEGVSFDFYICHDVPNETVLNMLGQADCVIDQIGGIGVFAREAMASGCAVASGYTQNAILEHVPFFKFHKETLKEDLREFLTNRELRRKLAHDGLAFVHRHHDARRVAQKYLKDLESAEACSYDYYPSYFATQFTLSENIEISEQCLIMQEEIIKRWGLPYDADLQTMVRKKLISAKTAQQDVMRWKKDLFDLAAFCNKPLYNGLPLAGMHKACIL